MAMLVATSQFSSVESVDTAEGILETETESGDAACAFFSGWSSPN